MHTTPGKLGLLFGYLALSSAITCGGKVTVDQGSASGDGGASAQSGSGTGNTGNASSQVNGAGGTANASAQAVAVAVSAGPSSGTDTTTTTTTVGPGSAAGGAGGGCSTCSDVIGGGGDPMDLCDESQQIFQAFIECICDFGCAMQCQGACSGGNPSNQCQQCIQQQCDSQLQACFNDF